MIRVAILLTITMSVVVFNGNAQQSYTTASTGEKKSVKSYNEALELRNTGQIEKAIAKLQAIIADDPSFIDAPNTLAGILYEKGLTAESADAFEKVITLDSFYIPRVLYSLGRIYLQNGEFSKARVLLQRYLDTANLKGEHKSNTEGYLQKASDAESIAAHPVPFEPKLIPGFINTEEDEVLPAITVDGQFMLFTRKVKGQEDLYMSQWDSTNQLWLKAEPMKAANTNQNEGAHAVSGDGSIIAFTACGRMDGAGSCDIYLWERVRGVWQRPVNAGGINSGGWDAQPAFTADGKGLYFSSDRPGGYGGRDLWYTERYGELWTVPRNLGPEINTSGNEESPFLFFDNRTLYFMSDGHPGLGDYDLFYSVRSGQKWSTPKNLGYPINTSGKEGALAIHPNGHTAYFTANRIRNQNDIWQFPLDSTLLPPPVSNLQGVVYDNADRTPVIADVIIYDLTDSTELYRYATDADGTFSAAIAHGVPYGVHISAPNYTFWSGQVLYPLTEVYGIKKVQVPLIPLKKEGAVVTGATVVLRNIQFESGSSVLLNSSINELKRLHRMLTEYPEMRIQIRGHTDNVGSPADNKVLSEARAKAVYDWLVNAGIDAARLTYRGYGETIPIASNDSKEGRAENRRTEFVIIRE